jgi:LytS/YehU family sensor histidine kinase
MVLTPLRYVIEQQFTLLTALTPGRLFSRTGNILFLVFSEMTIGGFAALLRLAIDHEKNKRKIVELEKVQIETELQFLKAQMSPHFLFNIINNIYSLTLIKSDKAPESLMKLSGLLRYILYESHSKVPLYKEMNALYAYRELFELKYENPLPITMNEHLLNREAFVEPILLIPLLENAFKHSGLGYWKEAYVVFEIKDSANFITAKIENSKQRNVVSAEPGGIGLENIKKRLEKVYGSRHQLLIEDLTDKYIVELKIPAG